MNFFKDKEILITGGTGSLGTTLLATFLCMKNGPKGIRIFSRDEFKQWSVAKNLNTKFPGAPVSFLIGDVRDKQRVDRAVSGVDFIINTAAMKQVPACEYNPIEAVRTNIHGAENIIDCAIDNKVKRVLHISTDKAVYPVNLYGATKTVAEKLFLHANVYSPGRTLFSCCRYGNVLSSRGSIVPLIQEQAKTGVVTLTHKEMTRFFIHLPDVADFIIDKLEIMNGGEVYVPKMPTILIYDLIKVIAPDCEVKEIGIRQGEKLHEVLITKEESDFVVFHDNYFKIGIDRLNSGPWSYSSQDNPWRLKTQEVIKDFIFQNTGE